MLSAVTYPLPQFTPPEGHPRVYLQASDIPRIVENATKPQNKAAWDVHAKYLTYNPTGLLPATRSDGKGDANSTLLAVVESFAFDCVTTGNAAHGLKAIEVLRNYINTVGYDSGDYNNTGQTVFTIGIVYDWCYDQLTGDDKSFFKQAVISTAQKMEIGWPPTKQGAVTGHGVEAQLQRDIMAACIALYDESPDMYETAAGRFFSEFIEPKLFMYPAHMHHQGSHYMNYRHKWEMLATWIFGRMGLPEVFGPEQHYTMYWSMYARRPDGHLLRDGDTHINNVSLSTYYTSPARSQFLAASYFSDPWLKQAAMAVNPTLKPDTPSTNQSMNPIEILVFNNPDLEPHPYSELPNTKYFPPPKGGMICRTGWNQGMSAPDMIVEMKINEWWFTNHQHLDAGAFQIYYKGALAIDSGYYQSAITTVSGSANNGSSGYGSLYDINYDKRSIAHNIMTVYDPNESFLTQRWSSYPMANDGGQRFPNYAIEVTKQSQFIDPTKGYRIGEVLGHAVGPDTLRPEFSYLKGDLKNAYSSKIEGYERSFAFLDLKDLQHPGVLIVYDRVVSSNPAFRKAWILHGLENPTIADNRVIFKDTRTGYKGKLTLDTLMPRSDNTTITKQGGPGLEGFVDGVNYLVSIKSGGANEGGGYRVEVSPNTPSAKDYFLNVLQVGDHTPDTAPLEPVLIESATRTGVQIADRVVLFGLNRSRSAETVTFTLPEGDLRKILVADLSAGLWQIQHNGQVSEELNVSESEGLAYFNGTGGDYRLEQIPIMKLQLENGILSANCAISAGWTYSVWTSTDLSNWQPVDVTIGASTVSTFETALPDETVRIQISGSGTPNGFYRLAAAPKDN
jgi:hypothetical protein